MTREDFIEKWSASLRLAAIAMDPRNASEKKRAELVQEFVLDAKAVFEWRSRRCLDQKKPAREISRRQSARR